MENIIYYHNAPLAPCHDMTPTRIDFYELTFLLEGSFTYTVDGQEYPMSRNDAVLISPGSLRQRITDSTPVQYVSFNFRALPDGNLSGRVFLPGCINSDIRKLLAAYPYRHMLTVDHARKLGCILNYILYEIHDRLRSGTDNAHILKILRYIDTHLNRPITLSDVSQHVNLTKEYTSAIFKAEMGVPLTRYVNERKLLLARELITHREMSLAEVAAYLGYENYNYFSRTFTRFFGFTPISVRKTNQNQ